jgi:hypothetical protein
MALTDLISKALHRRPAPMVAVRLAAGQVDQSTGSPVDDFVPEETYLEIDLAQMHLRFAGEWWREFLPLASVLTEVRTTNGATPLPYLVGPTQMKSIMQKPGPVEIANKRVIGPVPYRGDRVRLFVALYRATYIDWAARALGVLEIIGKQIDPTRVSSAFSLAPVVVDALEDFLGMESLELRFAFDTTLVPGAADSGDNRLQPGWHVFFGPGQPPDRSCLRVRNDVLHYEASDGRLYPLTEADFLLIHVRALDVRDDYAALEFASQLWPKVTALVWNYQQDAADAEYQRFMSALMQCEDLTVPQRRKLFDHYEKLYRDDVERAKLVRSGTARLDAVCGPSIPSEDALRAAVMSGPPDPRPDIDRLLAAFSS